MNIFEKIPYNQDKMGNRKIVDEKHILIMQVALRPGQVVPQHRANSNVHLLIVKGALTLNLDGADVQAEEGAVLPVAYQTLMSIKNTDACDATFLVLKTPNPSEMPQAAASPNARP